ncbi:sortase A [Arcanobacterium phocae]|uniref:Sortase A n=1 Tax=Arcanobacterium phocae TaxID=131112 RepID=A0A1H2L9U3_9ACTO|nr:class C sortase [Arcanobacterium phocae]SDU77800.1 sortase A [Arcanobacterium phocae]
MRVYVGRIITVILVWIGTGLLLYPTIASWNYQYNQTNILGTLGETFEHVSPDKNEQISMARKYNDALESGFDVKANVNVPTSGGELDESQLGLWPYEDILKGTESGVMGRILVPVADVDIPIYHGTSEVTLLKGAGHLEGTSLPVGGKGTRSVITAHRGLADATMFTNLDRVEEGDTFTLNIFGEVMTYRVVDIQVVAPEDSQSIKAEPGHDLVTLVTCTPLGINSHRILVTGERVFPTPNKDVSKATEKSELPHFPWWAIVIGAVLIGGVGILIHSVIGIRREKHMITIENSSQTGELTTEESSSITGDKI